MILCIVTALICIDVNSTGEITLPCGDLVLVKIGEDKASFTLTHCALSIRKDSTHLIMLAFTPKAFPS